PVSASAIVLLESKSHVGGLPVYLAHSLRYTFAPTNGLPLPSTTQPDVLITGAEALLTLRKADSSEGSGWLLSFTHVDSMGKGDDARGTRKTTMPVPVASSTANKLRIAANFNLVMAAALMVASASRTALQ